MVCLGSQGAYEYVEEFVFGGSLVWYLPYCRNLVFWYLHGY